MTNSDDNSTTASDMITRGWSQVGVITWIAVLLADIAVSVTSRTVGKPPWWLGPSVNPAPLFFIAIPLVAIVVPLFLFVRSHARATRIAIVCASALAIIAIADIHRTPGVAVVELVVAVAAILGSIATNAGVFDRR